MVQTFQIIERSFIQVIGCLTDNLANKLGWVFKPWPEQQTIAGHLNSEQGKVHYSDVSLLFNSPLTILRTATIQISD